MRSKLISALLGLILVACSAVIVMDQQGMLGNEPFPGTGTSGSTPTKPGNNNPYDLPPSTPSDVPSTSEPEPSVPETTTETTTPETTAPQPSTPTTPDPADIPITEPEGETMFPENPKPDTVIPDPVTPATETQAEPIFPENPTPEPSTDADTSANEIPPTTPSPSDTPSTNTSGYEDLR